MKHRKLRIAWSVGWGHNMHTRSRGFLNGARRGGKLGAIVGVSIVGIGLSVWLVLAVLIPELREQLVTDLKDHTVISSIDVVIFSMIQFAVICAVLGGSMMGAIGFLRAAPVRFSLRTLLIATTVVAVGLGLIVWASR